MIGSSRLDGVQHSPQFNADLSEYVEGVIDAAEVTRRAISRARAR
ncbi:antitoxin VbhA family protein [Protaetiibacter sp. SSC-01]|nr:antitoxin VbhA family protein [Protaetiibacter sp. SSC-01]